MSILKGILEVALVAHIPVLLVANNPTTLDPFSGNSIGGYSCASTVDPDTQTRSYAVSAHGNPASQRPNVRIVTGAKVTRILFASTAAGKTQATGVNVSIKGFVPENFHARKEVILAAGALNSPRLLELSGVGDRDRLEKIGIPVSLDLPGVGENLQDHVLSGLSYEANDGIETLDGLVRQEPKALEEAQRLYAEHKIGIFTMGGPQSHAFMPTPEGVQLGYLNGSTLKASDTEYHQVTRSIITDPNEASAVWFLMPAQANLHGSKTNLVGNDPLPENFVSLGCVLSHPLSRGSTHITSTDVDAPPNVDPQYLAHPADLEIMAHHLQGLEKLRHSKALAAHLKPNGKRNHPDAHHIGDFEGAKKYLVDTVSTNFHPCGSVAMLPKEKGGVVDPKLLVYGTENLRVVDASIFPIIPRGNIQSSVYAVAERAADIIKEQQSWRTNIIAPTP